MKLLVGITAALATSLLLPVASAQACTKDGACDKHERCPVWAGEGECLRSKAYMSEHCPASCQAPDATDRPQRALKPDECGDLHERCALWAQSGACLSTVLEYCAIRYSAIRTALWGRHKTR